MIYIDTHIAVWLCAGVVGKLSDKAKDLLNSHEIRISPIVRLELQYLYEIKRVTLPANDIVADLSHSIGLKVCDKDFNAVLHRAIALTWIRDPFDRIIVAHALLNEDYLVTMDQTMLDNYTKSIC
ncbi:MAG TPA: transposase [Desulfofustis sp.]|nr:transposase [Desulfofustis sp.]